MLPPDLKMQATRKARRMGISLGELIRISLMKILSISPKSLEQDPLFADKAVFTGRVPKDLAKEHDRYLYE